MNALAPDSHRPGNAGVFCCMRESVAMITSTAMKGQEMSSATTTKIDLGNNEQIGRCIDKNADGSFTAVTFSQSKTFKTHAGAVRWLAKRVAPVK